MISRIVEIARFGVVGLIATGVHFVTLTMLVEIWQVPPIPISSIVGNAAGISVSFVGNRYFVFQKFGNPISWQAPRFFSLYVFAGFIQFIAMSIFTQVFSLDYRISFLFATFVQILISYIGNKKYVFVK